VYGLRRLSACQPAHSSFDFGPVVCLNCSMEIHPQVAGFILYCTRDGKKWPDLYDEMCRVAGQGLYRGLRYRDLRKLGLSFGLNRLDYTIQLIEAVTDSRIDNVSLDTVLS